MKGRLFTEDFLLDGIARTGAWRALGAGEVDTFRDAVRAALGAVPRLDRLNEAATETGVIFPVLRALGWQDWLTQQAAARGRADAPDVVLFADGEAKRAALAEATRDRVYRHGTAIVESKRWDRALDRAVGEEDDDGVPSSQVLRYLSRVEVLSERAVTFGVLTNGRRWRLYWQGPAQE